MTIPRELKHYRASFSLWRWLARHEVEILRPFALIGLALTIVALLSGCGGVESVRVHEELHCAGFQHQDEAPRGEPFRYEWVKTRQASTKPWVYLYVADVDFACRMTGADPARRLTRIYGCAVWRPVGCTIYLQEGTQ